MQKGTDVEFKSLLTETEYNKLLDFFYKEFELPQIEKTSNYQKVLKNNNK